MVQLPMETQLHLICKQLSSHSALVTYDSIVNNLLESPSNRCVVVYLLVFTELVIELYKYYFIP